MAKLETQNTVMIVEQEMKPNRKNMCTRPEGTFVWNLVYWTNFQKQTFNRKNKQQTQTKVPPCIFPLYTCDVVKAWKWEINENYKQLDVYTRKIVRKKNESYVLLLHGSEYHTSNGMTSVVLNFSCISWDLEPGV